MLTLAYTSDRRVKNLLKSIHIRAVDELRAYNLEKTLFLRVFDESKEDALLWDEGGLTFADSETDLTYGSNDCAWYMRNKGVDEPLVVVEGTYGTERGQFGDGQHNRFSHALGAVKNGYTGVLFVPFHGESYAKRGGLVECESSIISMKNCYVRKTIVYAALVASDVEDGDYLVVDPYDPDILLELVVNVTLKRSGLENDCEDAIEGIKKKMKEFLGDFNPRERAQQLLETYYDENGEPNGKDIARFFTHNYEALTTAQTRDGHGLFGKVLMESYYAPRNICIFIRLTSRDVENLSKRESKEFNYLLRSSTILVISFDDLMFKNKNLRDRVERIRKQNLHASPEKTLMKEVKEAFEKGEILVRLPRP